MVPKADESYPKDHRILKRSDYLKIQQNGRKLHSRNLIGIFERRLGGSATRLGITVTRKFGPAVERNRFKRLVREAFRRGLMVLPEGLDVIVIAKKNAATAVPGDLRRELEAISKKIGRTLEAGH